MADGSGVSRPPAQPLAAPALEADGLTVRFRQRGAEFAAVSDVSFSLRRRETLTILGESGSGKSVTLKALLGLLPTHAKVTGSVKLAGESILGLPASDLARLRGRRISMVFQEPITALDPVYTIGAQIAETIIRHEGTDERTARARARALLERVRIPAAERRLNSYPHEMSGGMRQRAMIAIALACRPKLLIADEPTTALDVTVQAQVLELLADLRARLGMSLVLITHDLGVVSEYCDRVAVMYAGQVVETGPVRQVIADPRHPYTAGLLASLPRLDEPEAALRPIPGQVPDPTGITSGCRFAPRCPMRIEPCAQPQEMRPVAVDRAVRCVRAA
jgi:oligopeptide/dipeptide ABC transporter ATP-binding protein